MSLRKYVLFQPCGAIRQRSSPKSQVIFAFVFPGIGDFFGLIFVKLRRVCVFSVEMHAATLRLQTLKTNTAGAGQSIILR